MASNIAKASLLRATAIRGFASQAVPVSGILDSSIETTTLPNQITVASTENNSPLSRVSVLFRAGSRYEDYDNLGATHVLRIAAGLSTKNATHFSITRHIQQLGASLTCTTDRETIAYTLEGTREAVQETLPFLAEIASQQVFRPWELDDNVPRLQLELQLRPLQLRAIDLLHKAAFRSRGLGNSLFIAKHQVGKISSETLQHYVANNFTSARTALAGVGIGHEQLVAYAQNLKVPDGEGSNTGLSSYQGGEIRSDKGGNLAYIAVAGEGGALKNPKEVLAFAVLQHIFGAGPSIKYANEARGLLNKAAGGAARAINASYTDSGLFGALITVHTTCSDKVLLDTVKILKNPNIAEADVQRGKNQLKRAVLSSLENGLNAVESIGSQVLLTKKVQTPSAIAQSIEEVTLADVKAAAQKVAKSRLSIASVGNLKNVQFLDDLQVKA